MCLAQRPQQEMPVRLEPAALWSRVKHSTTEPLRSGKYKNHFESLNVNLLYNNGFLLMVILVNPGVTHSVPTTFIMTHV